MTLSDEIERLDGPSREMDFRILRAIGWTLAPQEGFERAVWVTPEGRRTAHREGDPAWLPFTASLNAAMTLVSDQHIAGVLYHAQKRIQETGFPNSTYLHRLICEIVAASLRARTEEKER